MTKTSTTFACARTRQMTSQGFRFWFAEVVREWTANDNEDAASWCARWSMVADDFAAKNWTDQANQVRQMVATARQANRPKAV